MVALHVAYWSPRHVDARLEVINRQVSLGGLCRCVGWLLRVSCDCLLDLVVEEYMGVARIAVCTRSRMGSIEAAVEPCLTIATESLRPPIT